MSAISTSSLSKTYVSSFGKKKVQALIDLNLNIERGTIFGLLGPNGAGKTTLIKILLQIIFPTLGNATILDTDISSYKIKSRIGYLPENHKYASYLTGGEVLRFFGRLSSINNKDLDKKIDELFELVGLLKWKKTKVKTYSKGMMQRLGLAQALINDPDLIFLDEPTDGVDPIGRKEIRDILLHLKSRSKTIFLNSHLLSEVEMITDRVGILNKGKLIREGTVQELTVNKEEYRIRLDDDKVNLERYSDKNISIHSSGENEFNVKVDDIRTLNMLIDKLRNDGVLIKEIMVQKNTLEEMFISLINKEENSEKAV
ncbi:daunorubicin/doxorubicin resistance ATP-binding protein DrrA [bacterium BMS3Abin03]|nr:daunorubicin/doxorubicin resistance ATP-binding protein DrrA [bacterium BMS3Abin03]HDZ58962.1 ABC transporter ATP-binding protein [Ignavibacteriales bacterium]